VASMILAMVKVLPEPVTPSQHLVALGGIHPRDQFRNRRALVARRFIIADQLEPLAALGLFRQRRAVAA